MADIWNGAAGKFIIAILSLASGAALNHWASRFNEDYKRRVAKSEEHFKDIKAKVIERTISVIADHWISMSRFNRSPIHVSWKYEIEPAKSVKEKSVESQKYVILPQLAGNEQYFQKKELEFADSRWIYEIDHVLYTDARDNHYPALFREVGECESLVNEYQRLVVENASKCAVEISNIANLPEYLNNQSAPHWIKAARMAKYVADKALGIEKHDLYPTQDVNSVLVRISGTQDEFFKVSGEKEVDKLYTLLDSQVSTFPVMELNSLASKISSSGEALLRKLNTLRGSEKLPDRCKLQWPN
jgi:hypothetical protein